MLDKIKLQNAVRATGRLASNNVETLLAQALAASADLVSESKQDAASVSTEANNKISQNAQNISELQSTAASHSAKINANTTAIENVANNLSSTQNDVATNAANIESVTSTISTTVEDVTQLKINVSKNTEDISGIDDKIVSLESKIDEHIVQFTSNKSDVDSALMSHSFTISNLTDRLSTNEENINAIRTDVDNLATIKADLIKVNENADYIRANASNIESLQTTVENIQSIKADVELVQANANRIASNLDQIEINSSNIESINSTVENHSTSIGELMTDVSTLQSKMTNVETKSDDNTTRLTTVENKVNSNETNITSLTSTVNSHTTDITELRSKDSSLDTDISNINLVLDEKATKSELQEAKSLITTAQSAADTASSTANEAKVLATANASSLAELTGIVTSKADANTVVAISNRVDITENAIDSLEENIEELSTNKANKTEIPDVSNFATKDELPTDYATKDELSTLSGKVDELEELKADVTAVNENAEYIRANAANLETLNTAVASLEEIKANATAVQANADRIEANLANITTNTEAVSALTTRVGTLENAGHLTASTLPSHLSGLVAVDGTNVTNAKHQIISKSNNKNVTAMLWNEKSGGGTMMKNEDAGKVSFIGVNNGAADGDEIWVQAYAKKISGNVGVRMTLTTDKMYYTKNQSNGSFTDNDEIVTVKDLPIVPDVSGFATKEEVSTAINNIEIPSINGLATEEYVNEKFNSVSHPVEGLATETYVDEKVSEIVIPDTSNMVDKTKLSGLVAIDGINVTKASHDIVTKKNNKNITSKIWNETSGGGVMMKNENADKVSFVGVNNGDGDNEIWVQGYAKNISNNVGTRITLSTTGFFYTKEQNKGTYTADDEVVTIKDMNTAIGGINIPDVSGIDENTGDVAMLIARLNSLENQLKAMKQTAVQSVDINTAEAAVLNNSEADFVCTNTEITNKVVNVNGKSIDITNSAIDSGRLALNATGDIELNDIATTGNLAKTTSNAAFSVNNTGYVKFTNADIAQTGYNTIEIGLGNTSAPKGVLIDNCHFGNVNNNTITIFNTVDNAVVTISNCTFGNVSNPIRISNRDNVRMTLNLINCTFADYDSNLDYRAAILCQDYTAKTAEEAIVANRFGSDKITVNVINCIDPSGNKIVEPENMSQILGSHSCDNPLLYVYYDKGGLQTYSAETYPTVHIS